ncbi:hypothetical protein HY947_01100 [Candidatus Gottesmanbacteria bacterium]|nr:hypothetical protein [Candidatus Gottesmanbacteria bacterium]
MLIIPVCFDETMKVRPLTLSEMEKRAGYWANVLAQEGLMKRNTTAADVIYIQPIFFPAASIFKWVDFGIWSESNPDFTFLSRFNWFVSGRKKNILARISRRHHPVLAEERYGYNTWLIRLEGATFTSGVPQEIAQIVTKLISTEKFSV